MPAMFYIGVEAVVEKDGKILISQRSHELDHAPGKWETPSGRAEANETLEDAAKREVKEELGIEIEVVRPYATYHFFRGPEKIEHQGVSFWCKYVSGEVVLDTSEQIDYKWVTPEEAIEIIEDGNIKTSIRKFIEITKKSA